MSAVFVAVVLSVALYLALIALLPPRFLPGGNTYTYQALERLRQEHAEQSKGEDAPQGAVNNPLVQAFLLLPGMQKAVPLLQRADVWQALDRYVLALLLVFLFLVFVLTLEISWPGLPLAVVISAATAWLFLRRRVARRRQKFLEQFPEALEAIVRSVRVGHPLHTAIRIIGENMPAPLGPEFQRVADETRYGATLLEALGRLARRMADQDVQFFTVVLAVHQEAGGNIAEALSNLARVIRQRKQFRLRVRALSSEGRASAWIVGLLPFFFLLAIRLLAPDQLTPLFTTEAGHCLCLVAGAMILCGIATIRQIVRVEA